MTHDGTMDNVGRHSVVTVGRKAIIAGRVVTGFVALCAAGATPAAAVEIITEQEAQRPDDDLPPFVLRGSPTRRPNVTIVSPAPHAGAVTSPFHLKIRFQVFGGAKIDPDSIVLSYKKSPLINLKQRLVRFITVDGIDIVDAEVPPGIHKFRIELRDKDGRVGGADFAFQVLK